MTLELTLTQLDSTITTPSKPLRRLLDPLRKTLLETIPALLMLAAL